MTDPEPESSAKRVDDSLLSYSLFNSAVPRLKYATDDVCDANEKKIAISLPLCNMHQVFCIKYKMLNFKGIIDFSIVNFDK